MPALTDPGPHPPWPRRHRADRRHPTFPPTSRSGT